MRIVVDVNLRPEWAAFLSKHGFAATHWRDIGAVDDADDKILEWARANDACILTADLDFGEMLAMTGGSAPSVVQIRARRRKVDLVGDRVVGALAQMRGEIALGALVTIDISRTRIRLLPLLERRKNG